MTVLGIDPGPISSAIVAWDGEKVQLAEEFPNERVCDLLETCVGPVAIENIRGYGMKVGNETFDTLIWIGRFVQAYCGDSGLVANLVPRKEILWHLCNSRTAGDKDLRQALIDRIGPQGTKKEPGPLRLISGSHKFAALAVAVYHHDMNGGTK